MRLGIHQSGVLKFKIHFKHAISISRQTLIARCVRTTLICATLTFVMVRRTYFYFLAVRHDWPCNNYVGTCVVLKRVYRFVHRIVSVGYIQHFARTLIYAAYTTVIPAYTTVIPAYTTVIPAYTSHTCIHKSYLHTQQSYLHTHTPKYMHTHLYTTID